MVCQQYSPPDGLQPSDLQQYLDKAALPPDAALQTAIPFIASGDLCGWDADQSYDLEADYVQLAPVAPPTAPAYREAKLRQAQAATSTCAGKNLALH